MRINWRCWLGHQWYVSGNVGEPLVALKAERMSMRRLRQLATHGLARVCVNCLRTDDNVYGKWMRRRPRKTNKGKARLDSFQRMLLKAGAAACPECGRPMAVFPGRLRPSFTHWYCVFCGVAKKCSTEQEVMAAIDFDNGTRERRAVHQPAPSPGRVEGARTLRSDSPEGRRYLRGMMRRDRGAQERRSPATRALSRRGAEEDAKPQTERHAVREVGDGAQPPRRGTPESRGEFSDQAPVAGPGSRPEGRHAPAPAPREGRGGYEGDDPVASSGGEPAE